MNNEKRRKLEQIKQGKMAIIKAQKTVAELEKRLYELKQYIKNNEIAIAGYEREVLKMED